MNKSSMRGIFLVTILVLSITVISIPLDAYAEKKINVKSVAFEETTIIEFTNNGTDSVKTFRMWLSSDSNFKSFKSEKGWIGEKTSNGVLIFTTSQPIKQNESIKFGVITDKPKPGINWKAIDENEQQIELDKTFPDKLPDIVDIKTPTEVTPTEVTPTEVTPTETQEPISDVGILSYSEFRIIPDKPNVGSTIRVAGMSFGTDQILKFFIDNDNLENFKTDENGNFVITSKIPETTNADRVDFIIRDSKNNEKKVSLRIGESQNRIAEFEVMELTITGVPDVIYRGDLLDVSGTAQPGSAVTATVIDPDGEFVNTRTAEVDLTGNWKLLEPILVSLDAKFGKYNATISDGRDTIFRTWELKSNKIVDLIPVNLKVDLGEPIKINGTALANLPLEIILEDPLGKEIASDIIESVSEFITYEFPTSQNSLVGTYTLIATQGQEKEFIFVGLEQLPIIPVKLEFDKLNYKETDDAFISLVGGASDIVHLLIVDPTDKPVGDEISITLGPDGRGKHTIDLEGFVSGVYTAIISKGNSKNAETFTVGLQPGSGDIEINTTKEDYDPGDPILLLGETGINALLTITLIDPDGNEVKVKETFSDKDGRISESSFRIPSDAKYGTWMINAKSGANFHNIDLEVTAVQEQGMVIEIEDGIPIPGVGKSLTIKVIGASQTVEIEIIAEDGDTLEVLNFPASDGGEINTPWIIPKDTEPGTYVFRATDAFNTAETTFEIV